MHAHDPGTYTVTLIVRSRAGVSTNTKLNYVTAVDVWVTAIQREGNDILVTWTCEGGRSYVLQSTKLAAIASYTTNFADTSPVIAVPGVGVTTTNYLDIRVAYAAVLASPGGHMSTTSTVPSTVEPSAQYTRGLANSLGSAVLTGSLLMLGAFSIGEAAIQSNFYTGNLSAIMSAFTPYTNSFTVGDRTGLPARLGTF